MIKLRRVGVQLGEIEREGEVIYPGVKGIGDEWVKQGMI